MPKRLKYYLITIIGLWAVFFTYSIYKLYLGASIDYAGIALFIFLSILSEILAVNMKYGSISVSFAINLAAILLFGPYAACIIASFGPSLRMREGKLIPWYKRLFNMAALGIATGLAGIVYQNLGGNFGQINLMQNSIALLLTIISYMVINNITIAEVISLSQNIRLRKIWMNNIKWTVPNYLALSVLGILISAIYLDMGIVAILLFFIPLTLARQSFKMYQDIKKVHLTTVQALISTIEAKDAYTKGHSERVAELSAQIARKMNYSESEIEKIKYAGYLHDVGKVSLESNILNKKGELTKKEYEIVKEHPEVGADIVKNVKYLEEVADYVKYHHERLDGSGYPEGLKGDEIPEGARILAVADVYDALTSNRPYRSAWKRNKALDLLKEESGECLDENVVDKLFDLLEERKKVS